MTQTEARQIMDSALKGADLSVMLALWSYSDKKGRCWPSLLSLATRSGLSRRAVLDSMRRLECGGLAKRNQRSGSSTRYSLDLKALPVQIPHRCDKCTRATNAPNPGKRRTPTRASVAPTRASVAPKRIKKGSEERTKERANSIGTSPTRLASDTWTELHQKYFQAAYPWVWKGQYPHDGTRMKAWLSAVQLDTKAPARDRVTAGIASLRTAMTAYFLAVKGGTAWPKGDPATTARFTTEIAKWLRTDPAKSTHQPGSMAANLQAMWDDMPAQGKL